MVTKIELTTKSFRCKAWKYISRHSSSVRQILFNFGSERIFLQIGVFICLLFTSVFLNISFKFGYIFMRKFVFPLAKKFFVLYCPFIFSFPFFFSNCKAIHFSGIFYVKFKLAFVKFGNRVKWIFLIVGVKLNFVTFIDLTYFS